MAKWEKRGNCYIITVYDGYTKDNKQIRHRKSWRPDPSLKNEDDIIKELTKVAEEFEHRVKGIKQLRSGTIKFSVVLDEYYKYIESLAEKDEMSYLTVDRYKDERERLIHEFGHKKLNKISEHMIRDFIKSLNEDGANKNTGKGLSVKGQKQVLTVISNVYKYAIDNNIDIDHNPCKNITFRNKKGIHKKETYTSEEAKEFFRRLYKAPIKYQLYFSVLALTGLRTEEIIGLKWNCVDLKDKIICIENSVSYSKSQGNIEHELKTKGSYRYIRITDDLANLFLHYRESSKKEEMAFGDLWIKSDYVFTGKCGGNMGCNTARNWLIRFCKKENIRYISPHQFRHFNATMLISSGLPINIVSNTIGHSNISTTTDIYCDAIHKADVMGKPALAERIDLQLDFGLPKYT